MHRDARFPVSRYAELLTSVRHSAPVIGEVAVFRIEAPAAMHRELTGSMGSNQAVQWVGGLAERLEKEIADRTSAQNFRIAIFAAFVASLAAVLASISAFNDLWSMVSRLFT
jgi:hypothetical protein